MDKYYYFPTTTKNILFVRGEKYVYLYKKFERRFHLFEYNHVYICHDFENGNVLGHILFRDEFGSLYAISPFDGGYFISLKQYRKRKLEKLSKIND
jgi:hypothetical protein